MTAKPQPGKEPGWEISAKESNGIDVHVRLKDLQALKHKLRAFKTVAVLGFFLSLYGNYSGYQTRNNVTDLQRQLDDCRYDRAEDRRQKERLLTLLKKRFPTAADEIQDIFSPDLLRPQKAPQKPDPRPFSDISGLLR